MKPLVIFKVGDTLDTLSKEIGDFDQWIINAIQSAPPPMVIIDPRKQDALPDIGTVAGAIVTGSHSMVTDRAVWSERLAAWLRSAVSENLPILGICYGHQLLAHALGGEVGYHPSGVELGTVSVKLTAYAKDDALFAGMPNEFAAQAVHRQSVRKLPLGAALLAGNEFEPHHAYRVGDSAWGVQFHPEFSEHAISGYIRELATASAAGEIDEELLMQKVAPTAEATSVLQRFADLARRYSNAMS
jgi:GMP synthase (glutamine-hydrolysing)